MRATTAPAAIAVEALSTLRRENRILVMVCLPVSNAAVAGLPSHSEQLAVARLDLLAHLFHRRGIVLHLLDLGERLAPRLLFDLRMQRAQSADVDDQLLRLGREAEALEQPRRVRIGRVLEQRVGADDERRAFGGVYDLDRAALLLLDEHVVLVAVR